MSRHSAFSFLLIASIFFIFSFGFPQQSSAAHTQATGRFGQCDPPADTSEWGWPYGTCEYLDKASKVQCPNFSATKTDIITGNDCAKLLVAFYKEKEKNPNIIGTCVNKCAFDARSPSKKTLKQTIMNTVLDSIIPFSQAGSDLTKSCNRAPKDTCGDKDHYSMKDACPFFNSTGKEVVCINYSLLPTPTSGPTPTPTSGPTPTPTSGPTPTPTRTPTPTPTRTPSCSDYGTCAECIKNRGAPPYCGWTGNPDASGSFCKKGTDSCPANPNWYYFDCSTNECTGPTPTSGPTPTPTPTVTPTPTPPQCHSCNLRNLSCPGSVAAGDLFKIEYEFEGTGPKYPYEHRAWQREDSKPIQAECSYGGNWKDCTWNQDRFWVTAPSTPGPHTYTVTCYGAREVNSTYCGFADDSKQCTVTVNAPPTPTSSPSPTSGPTPTPISGLDAQQQICNRSRSGWDNIGGGVCIFRSSCSNPPPPTPTPTSTPTPTPTPTPTYSISGTFFVDINRDGKKNRTENPFAGSANVSYSGNSSGTVNNDRGTYLINSLSAGQYTLTFAGLPGGFVFTYPPSSLTVKVGSKVGSPCEFPATSEASCYFPGSIINLNAGITDNKSAWFQSIGSDMRWDSGFANKLPSESTDASIPVVGGMPGIIFSGKSTPDFGAGKASATNWMVGSPVHPEVFTDTHNLIPTSYRFLLETAEGSGIAKKGLADLCNGGSDLTNCTLTPTLANGIYKIDGNLTLNGSSYTFPGGKNFVILINGNLTIKTEITVPVGSTVIFSASGNITVDKSVATINPASPRSNIEGLYSADNNFIADGTNDCASGTDFRLNIAGTVIANAARSGGTFINRRSLCINNSSYPSVSFIERPDFLLNYPSFVGQTTRAWQEVTP